MSGYRATKAWIPQGSLLGRYLFAVYTADISRQKGTILAQYAEDTAIGYRRKSVNTAIRGT